MEVVLIRQTTMNLLCSEILTALGENDQVRIIVEGAGAYTLSQHDNGDYEVSNPGKPLTDAFHVAIYTGVPSPWSDNDGRPDRPIIVPKKYMEDPNNSLCVRFPD